MKRLAAATVMLTGIAVGAQAGGLPKAIRMVERVSIYHGTHYVAGTGNPGSSGSTSGTTEARQAKPATAPATATATTAKPDAKQPKTAPTPARAD